MLRPLFFILLFLALVGDARIFLFVANRIVFGSHREEDSPHKWLLWATPPLLLAFAVLFWRVHLFVMAAIGTYWILDRIRLLFLHDEPVAGTHTLPSNVINLPSRMPLNDVYHIEVTRHEVFIDGLPPSFDGYRVAFLTDTHVVPFVRSGLYREVVAQVAQFDPDLVLLGGDFVTWERHIPLMADLLLTDLAARDGLYAVLGNHDYWASADGVVAAMTARGVKFVINRSIEIRRGDDALHVLGIDEVYRGEPDIPAAFLAIPRDAPRIGVSHHPDIIDKLGARRIDLLLCGHTHGGQIRFPLFGSVVVPSKHEARYASGFHRVGDVLLYVSRGIGAVPPLRILCKPEVATFILRRTHDAHETVRGLA